MLIPIITHLKVPQNSQIVLKSYCISISVANDFQTEKKISLRYILPRYRIIFLKIVKVVQIYSVIWTKSKSGRFI